MGLPEGQVCGVWVCAMPRLAGKTIVIIGAGVDGAGPLAQRLALLGAQVIAIGPHEAPLLRLARLHPEKIEVLAMDFHDLAACRRLARLWGREPVHGLINLMPLAAPVEPAQRALETVVAIMRPALVAGQGAVVCLATTPATAIAPVNAQGGRMRAWPLWPLAPISSIWRCWPRRARRRALRWPWWPWRPAWP